MFSQLVESGAESAQSHKYNKSILFNSIYIGSYNQSLGKTWLVKQHNKNVLPAG